MWRVEGSLRTIEEIGAISLGQRQKHHRFRALSPEVTVVAANTEELFIGVHLALAEDGLIYGSSQVNLGDSGSGGYPSRGRGSKGYETIRKAIAGELEKVRKYRRYYMTEPSETVNRAVDKAMRALNAGRMRQMSIFDILEDTTYW